MRKSRETLDERDDIRIFCTYRPPLLFVAFDVYIIHPATQLIRTASLDSARACERGSSARCSKRDVTEKRSETNGTAARDGQRKIALRSEAANKQRRLYQSRCSPFENPPELHLMTQSFPWSKQRVERRESDRHSRRGSCGSCSASAFGSCEQSDLPIAS